jgi:exonuclease VII large subunit
MGVYVHADSGELWNYYVMLSNIQTMADKECEMMMKQIAGMEERLEAAGKAIGRKSAQKESEISENRRKSDPDEQNNERTLQLKKELETLQSHMDELKRYQRKLREQADRVQKERKSYQSVMVSGRRFLNQYIRLIEEGSGGSSDGAENADENGFYKMDFRGVTFYCNDSQIDPDQTDAKGRTNLQRMEQGLAPIGEDGLPMNLHHMLQRENGPIIELSESTHQQNSQALHINSGSDIPSGIHRGAFGVLKKAYWQKRARILKGGK